jgi:hypothetical protein
MWERFATSKPRVRALRRASRATLPARRSPHSAALHAGYFALPDDIARHFVTKSRFFNSLHFN